MKMGLSFTDVIIIDWYDDIIKAFCLKQNEWYYCSLLARDDITHENIYVCIKNSYFKQAVLISEIIKHNAIAEHWAELYEILNDVTDENQSYLIKTKNLAGDANIAVQYIDNFNWNTNILFHDFPEILEEASIIDNWNSYW